MTGYQTGDKPLPDVDSNFTDFLCQDDWLKSVFQIMTGYQTGDKPLPEQLYCYLIYMKHHEASMGCIEYAQYIKILKIHWITGNLFQSTSNQNSLLNLTRYIAELEHWGNFFIIFMHIISITVHTDTTTIYSNVSLWYKLKSNFPMILMEWVMGCVFCVQSHIYIYIYTLYLCYYHAVSHIILCSKYNKYNIIKVYFTGL